MSETCAIHGCKGKAVTDKWITDGWFPLCLWCSTMRWIERKDVDSDKCVGHDDPTKKTNETQERTKPS